MKFVLRVESPLHLGIGQDQVLSWLDYHLEGKIVHVLDWEKVFAAASGDDEGKRDAILEKFTAWCDKTTRALDDAAEAAQKAPSRERAEILRRARDESSPARFLRDDLSDDGLAKRLRDGEFDRYKAEFSGGRLDRRLEIRRTAKDALGNPTIPGSAIRGQIRTALLHSALATGGAEIVDKVMMGSRDAEGWKKSLDDATPGRSRFLFGDALERAVLRPGSRMDDPRFDLMRLLRISDPVKSRATLIVVRESAFLIKPGTLNPLAPVVCEAIAEGSEFEFEFRADAGLVKGVAAADGGTHAFVSDEFWSQFTRVFGVTRDEARTLDEAALEERMLSSIEVAFGSRFSAISTRERAWFDRAGAPADAPLRLFHEGLGKIEGRVPLRLGLGAGLHGTTLVLALDSDAALAEPLSRALARAGLGLDPRKRRERAEREKIAIEKARRENSQGGRGGPGLRPELLAEKRDPKQLPVSRHFTMDGPLPDLFTGCVTFARGEISGEAIAREATLAAKTRALRAPQPEPERRPDRRPDNRADDRRGGPPGQGGRRDDRGRRPDRDDRRDDRGPPRRDSGPDRRPKGPPPKPLPDRPANEDEIKRLLDRFGRR